MIGKILLGNNICINILDDYFEHVAIMLLEHFDVEEYKDCIFLLGVCNFLPASEIKRSYPNKKVIVYQLEQLMGGCDNQNLVNSVIENIRSADEIWDYDSLNIEYLKYYSINGVKLVPMLYTEALNRIKNKDNPEIDLLFYGWMNPRRYNIFLGLQRALHNKVNIVWIYGFSNIESYLSNSKVILNIHAYEPWNRQEQVRMFYPLINGKLIISEISQINYFDEEIVESDIEGLSNSIIHYCQGNNWKNFGLLAKEKFKIRSNNYLKK